MNKSENIMNIATKRGFFFPTAEIYNTKAGFWTYGHLGKLMKNKFENLWRNYFLKLNPNFYEIEGSDILPEKVFQASGHLKNFNDPLTECNKCHIRYKADDLIEEKIGKKVVALDEKELTSLIKENKIKCPNCKSELMPVKFFNMMFDVKIGATGNELGYLSPETAQNSYLSFKREFSALREKLPMGLAIIGKAFRNEISPRQGFFRLREFIQAELQIFFDPDKLNEHESWKEIENYKLQVLLEKEKKVKEISCNDLNKNNIPKFYIYYLAKIQQFYLDSLKIPKEKFRFRQLSEKEKAFYNTIHFDIELDMETLDGFKEVSGLHYRTNYDLINHQQASNESLEVFYNNKKFIPHVLEISFGIDRNIWALMDIFYKEEKDRTLFLFPSTIAPVEVAVFPLVNKDGLPEKATEVYNLLKNDYKVISDYSGSIGRMYRRVDEIGVPAMITIDHQTLNDNTVTLRDITTMKQIRISLQDLKQTINKFLSGVELKKLGKII